MIKMKSPNKTFERSTNNKQEDDLFNIDSDDKEDSKMESNKIAKQ